MSWIRNQRMRGHLNDDGIEWYDVQLINMVRQRKRRIIILDRQCRTMARTLEVVTDPDAIFDLRKIVRVNQYTTLLPSETDKKKLKVFIDPVKKPTELLFKSAADRENFCATIDAMRVELHRESSRNVKPKSEVDFKPPTYSTDGISRISLFCSTFNCSKEPPPTIVSSDDKVRSQTGDGTGKRPTLSYKHLYSWIAPRKHDVYFFGLQECKAKHFNEWQDLLLSAVHGTYHSADIDEDLAKFVVLSSVSMWGIHGVLIVRETIARYFSRIRTDFTRCGFGGVLGNKGAVGIECVYGDGISSNSTNLAFVCSHLAARAERVLQRNTHYSEICKYLLSRKKNAQFLHKNDHIFWVGDMNYRIDMGLHGKIEEFDVMLSHIDADTICTLNHYDQLTLERCRHNVFVGFREGDITFAPTYRLNYGQFQSYNNKRNQNPSWTDRILYKSLPGVIQFVEQTSYKCATHMIYSDHRPVFATFSILTSLGTKPHSNKDSGTQEKPGVLVFSEVEFHTSMNTGIVENTKEETYPVQQEDEESAMIDYNFEDCEGVDEEDVDDVLQQRLSGEGLYSHGTPPTTSTTTTTQKNETVHRRNSYGRPMTLARDAMIANLASHGYGHESGFSGVGFCDGNFDEGQNTHEVCAKSSSEYERYVKLASPNLESQHVKLVLSFQGNFLEEPVYTKDPVEATSTKLPNKCLVMEYQWNDNTKLVPYAQDQALLAQRSILICVHKYSKTGPIVGQAHVSLRRLLDTCENVWFVVPVICDGIPAGLLRGKISTTFVTTPSRFSERLSDIGLFGDEICEGDFDSNWLSDEEQTFHDVGMKDDDLDQV